MFPSQPPPNSVISLIPANDDAKSLLYHEHNRHLVSQIPQAKPDAQGRVRVGFNLSLQIATESRNTLVVIGKDRRQCQIFADGASIGKVHCTIELKEGSTDMYIAKRSPKGSIGFFGRSAQPLNNKGYAVMDKETNTTFGIGHRKGDLYVFVVYWHKNVDWNALANRRHMCSQTRSTEVEMTPHEISQGDERRVLRIHTSRTPAGKLRMNYEHIKHLGSGGFGTVSMVRDIDSGTVYACKKVQLPDIRTSQASFLKTKREVEIPFKFNHPHIIKYVFAQRLDQRGVAYFEIFTDLKQGSINDLIRNGDVFRRSRSLSTQVLLSMLRALEYIADQNFIHRDIKPANILYSELHNGQFEFFLADFGLVNTTINAQTKAGTPGFWAPELQTNPYDMQSPKADIWSLFVTFATMIDASGFRRMPTENLHDSIRAVREATKDERCKVPADLEPMARVDPAIRASARQMLVILNDGIGAASVPDSQNQAQGGLYAKSDASMSEQTSRKGKAKVQQSPSSQNKNQRDVKDRGMFVLQTKQPPQPIDKNSKAMMDFQERLPSKAGKEIKKSKSFWGLSRRTSSGMSGLEYS